MARKAAPAPKASTPKVSTPKAPKGKNLKASVKWSATTAQNIKLQVGKKSFSIPVEARTLVGGKYVYISLPLSSAFYEMSGKKLLAADDNSADLRSDMEEAMGAAKAAKKAAKRGGRGRRSMNNPTLDDSLIKQLMKNVPAGYKLAVKDGVPVVVKGRVRRKK